MEVHLIDGTYELFRQYFGRQARQKSSSTAAVAGVLSSVVSMLDSGVTHVGVATDHVIESFRNALWPGYKTAAGVPGDLLGQFGLLEQSLEALGVVVFAMVELEADDALASAAAVAAADPEVDQVVICTPDKDLAQCVQGRHVVQLDRRNDLIVDEDGVRAKFGVGPKSIPDWLALVGDSADGFPGLPGWGKRSAAAVLDRYAHLRAIPDDFSQWDPKLRKEVRNAQVLADVLRQGRDAAELFLDLATLRVEPPVVSSVGDLEWTGPSLQFGSLCDELGEPRLALKMAEVMRARGL